MADLEKYKIPTIEDVPPLNQHKLEPKEILSAGINQFAGRLPGAIFDNAIGAGEHSPEKKLHKLKFAWLIEQIPHIQNKLDLLIADLSPQDKPEASDVSALLEAANRVSRKTADARKRRLLKTALVNAFDKELYLEGITLRLMEILEDLYYGDVQILNKINIKIESDNSGKSYFQEELDDQELHHVEVLEKYALVKLTRHATPPQIIVRALGHKLLRLVLDDDYPDNCVI